MHAHSTSRVAAPSGQKVAHQYGMASRSTSRTVPHQGLSACDNMKLQRAQARNLRREHGASEVRFLRNAIQHEMPHQMTRLDLLEKAALKDTKAAKVCRPEYQVTLRHQLEVYVLSDQRNRLDLEIRRLAEGSFQVESSTGSAIQRAAQSTRELDHQILIRKLLLREQQANPQHSRVSLSDPVLDHQANTLLSQRKRALEAGLEDPTLIQYPKLNMDMDVEKATLYLNLLDNARLCEEIQKLKDQAAVMQSQPQFRFCTDGTSLGYHSLVQNFNHLKAAQAELEVVNDRLRKHMEKVVPKLSEHFAAFAASRELKSVQGVPSWMASIVCHF